MHLHFGSEYTNLVPKYTNTLSLFDGITIFIRVRCQIVRFRFLILISGTYDGWDNLVVPSRLYCVPLSLCTMHSFLDEDTNRGKNVVFSYHFPDSWVPSQFEVSRIPGYVGEMLLFAFCFFFSDEMPYSVDF